MTIALCFSSITDSHEYLKLSLVPLVLPLYPLQLGNYFDLLLPINAYSTVIRTPYNIFSIRNMRIRDQASILFTSSTRTQQVERTGTISLQW